jgi:hypothetical protein
MHAYSAVIRRVSSCGSLRVTGTVMPGQGDRRERQAGKNNILKGLIVQNSSRTEMCPLTERVFKVVFTFKRRNIRFLKIKYC